MHGHFINIVVCEPDVKKDSNLTIDILASALQDLALGGTAVADYEFVVQADNTCRENKNNNLLRWLASLVCVRRVRSARLCFLMSGHTHEDIDQLWGVLAQHLVHCDELETPEDFQAEMQDFLEKHPRRYEAGRRVRRVDKIHDWKSFLEKTGHPSHWHRRASRAARVHLRALRGWRRQHESTWLEHCLDTGPQT